MSPENKEKELVFEDTRDKIVKFLEAHHAIVLATALDKRVTIRTVTYATKGLEVYFMSFGHHKKIKQMEKNSRVALCKDNVNIEGVAEILGSPLDERNKEYAEIYKRKLPRDYAGFAHIPEMVMVKVTPRFIVSMVRIEKNLYLEHLDLENKGAYLKKLQDETY